VTTRPSRAVWLPVVAYLTGTLAVPACGGALANAAFREHAVAGLGVVATCVAARVVRLRGARALAARMLAARPARPTI
jgi:hypothetical protein